MLVSRAGGGRIARRPRGSVVSCGGGGGGQEQAPAPLTLFSTCSETDEKVLTNMTEDGKKLLATADSVFTKVTEDLLDGTVLVGHLELIMKHTNQFLDICQLSECQRNRT